MIKRSHTIYFIISILWITGAQAGAEMRIMENRELSAVIAGIGLELGISNSLLQITQDRFRITDSDGPDYLEFSDFVSHEFSINTPVGDPIKINIGGINDDGYVVFEVPDLTSNVLSRWRVGNIAVSGTDLGSLNINPIAVKGGVFRLDALAETGMPNGQLAMGSNTGEIVYSYNDLGDVFACSGIYIAQSVQGAPEDPANWAPLGAMILDFQVRTDPGLEMDLPISGTMRIENVGSGGVDLGPAAVDDIRMHRFRVALP